MPHLLLILTALTALTACTGETGGCAVSDDPTLVIGVGDNAYAAHSDGDSVELIRGPQGGFHINLAVETTGFAIDEDLLGDFEGTIGGSLVGQANPFVFLRCNNQTDTQQAWDLRLVYDDEPENLDDQTTEVTVQLEDADGRTATATTTFVIDDPSI